MPTDVDGDINMGDIPNPPMTSMTLQEQLQEALSHEALSFTGNYYHAQLLPSAPNPCLSITGLGPIGLPLVEDYAKRIISVADLAHKECGASGAAIRGIWQVESTQISFLNPGWDSYISDTLCREVCTALGASISAPKMELRKLLLYEEGANHSARPDPQRADNMFATVTVFLPSTHDGGEVILSHAPSTTTINFAAQSAYSSALLATYNDVVHELRPISAGYCMALSYDLIHTTAPTEPCPSPPKILEASSLLRIALRKWRDKLDSDETEQNRMAYLLEHTYDPKDVKDVVASLKGVDAYRVRILRDIGAELGIILGFATLECMSSTISYVLKGPTTLERLTGLDGEPLLGLTKSLNLPSASISTISDIVSKSNSSRKTQSDGSFNQRNGKRSILLLIDEKHQDDLRFEVEGLSVAVQVLRETSQIPPNQENIKWAKRILQYRKKYREGYTSDVLNEMLIYSLDWKNLEIWKQLTDSRHWDFDDVHTDILFRAYRTFPFNEIQESFSKIMSDSSLWCENRMERPVEIITFLHSLSIEAAEENGRDMVQAWCERSVKEVLWRCSPEGPLHAESILQVIRLVGMHLCGQYMLPTLIDLVHERYFDFWMALHALLRDQRQSLLADLSQSHPDPDVPMMANSLDESEDAEATRSTTNILDDFIEMSLCIPSISWFKEERPYSSGSILKPFLNHPHDKFNPIPGRIIRLISVLDACMRANDTKLCESVLEQSLEVSGNPMWYFTESHIPIISRLRDLLTPVDQEITQPPFTKFLRKLVGRYLSQVLGKRGPVVDIGLRKLGCKQADCDTCKKIDAFILNTLPEIQLHMDGRDCYHAEGQLEHGIDLCTYERLNTSRSRVSRYRQTLEIKKHESVIRCSEWDYRLSATKLFLESVGSDSDIADIMGDRYADVQSALAGRRKFVWDEKRDAAQNPSPALATSPVVDAGDSSVPQDSSTTSKPARVLRDRKRKRT